MMLSQHFSLAELCVTSTGLENVPDAEHVVALKRLCENVLEPVRAHFNRPVVINSGFRSFKVNAAASTHPSTTSQHLFGEAADFEIPGIRNDEIWVFIAKGKDDEGEPLIPFDQLIAEKLQRADGTAGWIHCSYRQGRLRRDAISFNGKKYLPGLEYIS